MVPSERGRAERPSAKKSLGRRGGYFGWSCMSCRHAERAASDNTSTPSWRLVRNFGYLPGLQGLQELGRFIAIEQRIGGFDAQEETVAAGQRKSRHVEGGVIRHRQAAQAKQAEDGGKGREED